MMARPSRARSPSRSPSSRSPSRAELSPRGRRWSTSSCRRTSSPPCSRRRPAPGPCAWCPCSEGADAMSRTVGILGALHGPDELAFVTAVESLAPGVVLARRCGDLAELLAAAEAGLGQLAVVSADLPGLDRDAVAALFASGVRPIALADPPEGWLAERTRALGIAVVVAPEGAVGAVSREAARLRSGGDGSTATADEARAT